MADDGNGRAELPILRVRLAPLMLKALEAYAARLGTNTSQAARDCLASALMERGVWPPLEEPAEPGST